MLVFISSNIYLFMLILNWSSGSPESSLISGCGSNCVTVVSMTHIQLTQRHLKVDNFQIKIEQSLIISVHWLLCEGSVYGCIAQWRVVSSSPHSANQFGRYKIMISSLVLEGECKCQICIIGKLNWPGELSRKSYSQWVVGKESNGFWVSLLWNYRRQVVMGHWIR